MEGSPPTVHKGTRTEACCSVLPFIVHGTSLTGFTVKALAWHLILFSGENTLSKLGVLDFNLLNIL